MQSDSVKMKGTDLAKQTCTILPTSPSGPSH